MAVERQSPDVLLDQTNLSGTVAAIQDDPDTSDANWLTAISDNADSICRTSFPTPTGSPTAGADLQEFRIRVRKMGGSGATQIRIELYENGVFLATPLADTPLTSTTGITWFGTWNANLLGTADGSLVECRIYGTKAGGGPSTRAAVEVGAVEWNVEYSGLTAVGDTLQPMWDVRQAVSDTLQPIFHIRALASDTIQALFNVRALANKTSQTIWHVRALVNKTTQAVWHVRGLTSQSRQAIWHVRGLASQTNQYIWNVLSSMTAVSDVVELRWAVRAVAGKTAQAVFNVRQAVSDTVQTVWNVSQVVGVPVQAMWDVRQTIGNTVQAIWGVRQAVSDTLQAVWNVLVLPSTQILRFLKGNTVRQLQNMNGDTRSPLTVTGDTKWL